MPDNEIEIRPDDPGTYIDLMDAVDLAADQDRRTRITEGGKTIAWIVTAEDGERLAAQDPMWAEYRQTRAVLDPLVDAAREAQALNEPISVTQVPGPCSGCTPQCTLYPGCRTPQ